MSAPVVITYKKPKYFPGPVLVAKDSPAYKAKPDTAVKITYEDTPGKEYLTTSGVLQTCEEAKGAVAKPYLNGAVWFKP